MFGMTNEQTRAAFIDTVTAMVDANTFGIVAGNMLIERMDGYNTVASGLAEEVKAGRLHYQLANLITKSMRGLSINYKAQ